MADKWGGRIRRTCRGEATFRAACERWPGTPITLRQGARVIEDSRRLRVVWGVPRGCCRSDLGERRASRLVATAAEDRLNLRRNRWS
jgi:hypothetical protein